jgi:hypothetical protein
VNEAGVNDSVGSGGSRTQAVQIFQIAAMHLGTESQQMLSSRIRTRQTDNLMARTEEVCDQRRAYKSSRTSDEYAHKNSFIF